MQILQEVRPRGVWNISECLQFTATELGTSELAFLLSPFDLKRLESYANNMLDYHVILDLMPTVASFFFERRLGPDVQLSAVQSSILLALGLQRKTIEEVEVPTLHPPPEHNFLKTPDICRLNYNSQFRRHSLFSARSSESSPTICLKFKKPQ